MSDFDPSTTEQVRSKFLPETDTRQPDDEHGFQSAVSSLERITLRAIPTWNDGGLQTPDGTHASERSLPSGRGSASGGGGADGNPLRQARGRGDLERPNFNIDVPPGGYAWWYVDGVSDDGLRAVSVIAYDLLPETSLTLM